MAKSDAEKPDALEQSLLATATTFEERAAAFKLAGVVRQQTMLRKAAEAMAEYGWGKEISPIARAAVARYCYELGADPLNHVYVLGGNVYLNANFYRDLCAVNPDFVGDEVDFIHHDERATAEEKARRLQKRIDYGVPEKAPGAAIVTLHYKDRDPSIGVNWAGVRDNDPVGKQEPTKTAWTRAYRKAAMKAESAWFRTHPRIAATEEIFVKGGAIRGALPPVRDEEPVESIEASETTEPERKAEDHPGPLLPTGWQVQHHPTAFCNVDGLHPAATCGYEQQKKQPGVETKK